MSKNITIKNNFETEEEMLGTLEISKLSCVARLTKDGLNLTNIKSINRQIQEIATGLWNLAPLAIEIHDGDESVKETFNKIKDQVHMGINKFMKIVDEIKDCDHTCDDEKDDDEQHTKIIIKNGKVVKMG